MSQLNDTFKYMSDKGLLETLHNSYRDLLVQRSQGIQTSKLNGIVNEHYNELIHRLSAPDSNKMDQLLLTKDIEGIEGYDKQTMTQLITQIEHTYKTMYEKLVSATDTFAQKAINDFMEKRASGLEGYSNNTEWDFYNSLPTKNDLETTMAKGNAHPYFTRQNKVPKELGIFHPTAQITGLSLIKKSLLNDEKKLPENSSWHHYRNKTISAIDTIKDLGSKTNRDEELLSEVINESSPYARAFKDAVNYVCEGLGLDFRISMSKTQEFKKALSSISASLQVENPIEQDDIVKKSPKL
ncbi:MAG: hypothetical protein H0T84_08810 [Tatlockia sp.]|nr:hypothetical protein [Tatlockia sp.]